MQAKMQIIQKHVGYAKCGEILRPPPSDDYQHPYILKCFHCSEIYLLYEAFIFHIEDHCKLLNVEEGDVKNNDGNISESTEAYSNQEHGEIGAKFDLNIKVENNQTSMQTEEDPLINTKHEHNSESGLTSLLEVELNPTDLKAHNTSQIGAGKTLSTVNELCESENSAECSGNKCGEEIHTTDEEIENSSYGATSEEDDEYEIRIKKHSDGELADTFSQSAPDYDFLKTRHYINSLIEAYKNQPTLWNKNFPFLREKLKRQNCYQEIANELKKQHDLSITWSQVASAVVFLCRKYREDLKGLREAQDNEETYSPSWFFESLNFLKPFAENNQIAKLDSHLPDLLPYQIIEILEIYKGLPHLWNTAMIEHYCRNKIDAAKQEMLEALNAKLGLKITVNILEEYFRTINNCFARAKRNKLDTKTNKTNNSEANNDDYYECMLFLNDHVGSFNCSDCKRCFKSPMYLKIHQTQAHDFEPLPCSLCKKKFRSVSAYTNHAKRHMEDFNHECKDCGKKFLQSNELKIHMRNHTGAKPFCCEICGASFRHIQSFTHHHRRHIKKYLHSCEICGKGFYTKDRYKDHMNSHSNTRNQVCKVCGKTFITKRTLRQHAVIHDDIRRHACKLCGKAFKHKTGVTQHMRTHGVTTSEEKTTTSK